MQASSEIERLECPERGVVMARRAMVAASHPLAVSAGLAMLQRGGNAVDAAVAAAAVLTVVEPFLSQVGGDNFMLIYSARTGEVRAINSSGAAPRAARIDAFPGRDTIPQLDPRAITVPGCVDGWHLAVKFFGRMSLREVLEPAIDYAEHGAPVTYRVSRKIEESLGELSRFPETVKRLTIDGRAPRPGEVWRQPDLARTLREIAIGGRDAFYRGEIARRIAAFVQELGGWLSADDFAAHRAEILDPISTTYRGFTVYEQPPVSQGCILLEELNILEGFDIASLSPADRIHVQVEAKKLAFADRSRWLADPRFFDLPLRGLLSKEYAAERSRLIDMRRAREPEPGDPRPYQTHTTYLCAVDGEGNCVSFIQSVFANWGCGIIAGDTGVLLNNRMCGFSLDPRHPNRLEPGKRPVHTLNTYLVLDRGNPYIVGGTPGGDVQVQTNLQVLCNLIDLGMNPQEAADAPRWSSGRGLALSIENRVPAAVREALAERGHRITLLGSWGQSGRVQLIVIDPTSGALLGGSDSRWDGYAAGW